MSEPKYAVGWTLPDGDNQVRYLSTLLELQTVLIFILKAMPNTKIYSDKTLIRFRLKPPKWEDSKTMVLWALVLESHPAEDVAINILHDIYSLVPKVAVKKESPADIILVKNKQTGTTGLIMRGELQKSVEWEEFSI